MPSQIAWLDFDTRQNDRMNQILDLFKETGTLDELGIGNIRDSFANLMFPGTSTVQTRLRYFLITAWIYRQMEREHVSPNDVARRVHELERDLIQTILDSGESGGVFGRISGRDLKILPSAIYWSGLISWQLVRDISRTQYHRQFDAFWWESGESDSAWAHVPKPPDDFPKRLVLDLTFEEADYLRSRISKAHEGTLLHQLVTSNEPPPEVSRIWEHPDISQFNERSQKLMRHAHLFALVNEGANSLYNLMLTEELEHDEWQETQMEYYDRWRGRLEGAGLGAWDIDEMWEILEGTNHTIHALTRIFVEEWTARVLETDGDVRTDPQAREIISRREQHKKGARSKFKSRARLDQWHGGAEPTSLDYRWGQTVRGHLNDLHAGLGRYDART